jgi:ATP-dependent Clp protease protease subunit
MIKITDKAEEKDTKNPEEAGLAAMLGKEPKEIRTIALFGDVDEEKAGDLCMGLLMLTDFSEKEPPYDPITFYLSTYGGSADEMFSIYDMMTITKSKCQVKTIGLGKIMSAGTLLLAAGTKGQRKIGKHCRVMIHSVAAGSSGELHNIENEVKSIKHIQELYINALSRETGMTKRTIEKLLDRKVNVYLTAEEAVEYGLADEIIG